MVMNVESTDRNKIANNLAQKLTQPMHRRRFLEQAGKCITTVASKYPLSVKETAKAGITGGIAGLTVLATKELLNTTFPYHYHQTDQLTHDEVELLRQPYTENRTVFIPGEPVVHNNSLEFTRDTIASFLSRKQKSFETKQIPPEERPTMYEVRLYSDGINFYPYTYRNEKLENELREKLPTIKIIPSETEFSVLIDNGQLLQDNDGNFTAAYLELPASDISEAYAFVIEHYKKEVRPSQEPPAVIQFAKHDYLESEADNAVVHSSVRLSGTEALTIYDPVKRVAAFTGIPFEASVYASNAGDDQVPDHIRAMAFNKAVIPLGKIREGIGEISEIIAYYEVMRGWYRQITTHERYRGDPQLAKDNFDKAILEFDEKFYADTPEERFQVFSFLNIENYFPELQKGFYDFGDIQKDPEKVFASALTVWNFFGDVFAKHISDPESHKAQHKLISRTNTINNNISNILKKINNNDQAKSQLVKKINEASGFGFSV